MRSICQDLIQIPCVSDPSIYAIGAQFAYGIGGRLRSPIGVRYWTSRHWPSSPFWWHLGDFHTHWVQASIRSPRLTWSRREIDHHISGMGGAELFPAGRGEGENPRGGAQKASKSTYPKIRQKCVNCCWDICTALWCFIKENIISFHFKKIFLWTR